MRKLPGVQPCCECKAQPWLIRSMIKGYNFSKESWNYRKALQLHGWNTKCLFQPISLSQKVSLPSRRGKESKISKVLSGIFKDPRFSSTCPGPSLGTDVREQGGGGNKPKTNLKKNNKSFLIQIAEQNREVTPWSRRLSSSTPSPGLSSPFPLNSASSIQINVIITPAQQSSSLNYNTLPAQCAKSTSLSLFPH